LEIIFKLAPRSADAVNVV